MSSRRQASTVWAWFTACVAHMTSCARGETMHSAVVIGTPQDCIIASWMGTTLYIDACARPRG